LRLPGAREIDDQGAHRASGVSEEVRTVRKHDAGALLQLEESLVQQRRRADGVAAAAA
jgi:hypothetical protein